MSRSSEASPLPGEEAAVQVTALRIVRAGKNILRDIDFAIPRGRITGLLGPSGSGKTTLMRAIVGVQRITSGSVTVLGRPAGDPALRHELGYVTQAASVYLDLSVEANVRYFGAMHRTGRRDAAEAIAAVGLEGQARTRTADLSGGELSRVSLACALVGRPKLLILDEPTVGLDPVLRADLWDRFGAMAASGSTLLISSHVMEEASHCASLLLLRQGRLLASLTPAELSARGRSEDLELAFLNIIRQAEAAEGPPQRPGAGAGPGPETRRAADVKVTE
ncbi:ABC transporter ATP-binding protein [Arthrobacter sp. RHLT1-20]